MSAVCSPRLLTQVTGTCKAFPEDMLKYLTTFLEPWFKTPNSATYKIAFKARNSSHNKRDDIIKSIAGTEASVAMAMSLFYRITHETSLITTGLVGKLNRKNKVDLTSPELTIIVEVIKAVCCVSVVKDYTLYRKYNVQEVVKDETPKADGDAAKAEPDAAEQEEAQEAEETDKEKSEDGENGIKNLQQDNVAGDKCESDGE